MVKNDASGPGAGGMLEKYTRDLVSLLKSSSPDSYTLDWLWIYNIATLL